MNIETVNDYTIHLSISERNLRGLLQDFETYGYARIVRTTSDPVMQIALTVETDEKHYADRPDAQMAYGINATGEFPLGQSPDDREAGLS